MIVKTSGTVRRIDLGQVVKLLPPLFDEWARLGFDSSGAALNPVTGTAVPALTLVEGRHRAPGARYRVTVETPRMDVPEARRAEFDREFAELSGGKRSEADWAAHFKRRHEASVQVGVDETTCFVTITEDDAHGMVATVSDDRGRWTLDVDIRRGVFPRVEATGRVDLTAIIEEDVRPGCLARLLGGKGEGAATLDLGHLATRGGRLVEARGQANRFRGVAHADVATSGSEWKLDGELSLRARGLGRVVLLIAGRVIRRHLDRAIERLWASSGDWITAREADSRALTAAAEREGGVDALVHRMLWDPEFDLPRP